MNALKIRFSLFAAAATSSSTFSIKTITTLRVSLPLTITPNSLLPRGTLFSLWSVVQFRGAKVSIMHVQPGDVIQRKGSIYQVLNAKETQKKRGGATIQMELRDVESGNKKEESFQTDEAFEIVSVEDKSFTYLYTEGDFVTLMEPTTFEQTEVPKDFFGKSVVYLQDELKVTLQYYDGNPMSASVPPHVTCTVTEAKSDMEDLTATPQHGGNLSSQYKRVLLDNGLTVQVPPFIEVGDEIIINTEDDSYMTRAEE